MFQQVERPDSKFAVIPDTVIARPKPPEIINSDQFLNQVLYQFDLQGKEPDGLLSTGHPDPTIRAFYRSALKLYTTQPVPPEYLDLLADTHSQRPSMDETFYVNLLFRASQCVLRNHGCSEYVNYRDDQWDRYFQTDGHDHLKDVGKILQKENTATHVPQRYRSLNAALRLITRSQPNIDLRVGDVGCSLGLGLKACLANGYLKKPPFVDDTPDHFITALFDQPITRCSRAVGVDIRLPPVERAVEWVKACNYPSRYVSDGAAIDQAIIDLSTVPFQVDTIQADILQPESVDILTGGGRPLNVVYSSMAMYELSPDDKSVALKNISKALSEGGVFIEFTFVDPKDWFKGIKTTVATKQKGQLSEPKNWLFWHDSRCGHVEPGSDFADVNQTLARINS